MDSFFADGSDMAAFYAGQTERHGEGSTKRNVRRLVDLPKHGPGERFIRGPIPLEWMKLAAKCGGRAEAVAVLLWYAAGFQRSNPVKLSAKILAELHVHPKTAKRVLVRMKELGLVNVEFHRGRSPVVTITTPTPAAVD